MNHTLGPWHIGMKPGPMIYGPHGEQIADMRRPAMVDDAEHAANARLIAAAPDLLAALELAQTALIACGEYLPISSDADTLAPVAMREASKAIARAKGVADKGAA